jgi:hypothetical protein
MPITLDMEFADFNNRQIQVVLEKCFKLRLEEAKLIAELCLANDVILAIRVPGEMIVQRLNEGCMGKGLSIKAKTASVAFPDITGLIPTNPEQSKLSVSNPILAERFGEMLNKKLEEDYSKIENLKSLLISNGEVKKEISKLQLITKLSSSRIIDHSKHKEETSEIVAYVTEITRQEGKEDFLARVQPVTSDYDPALIATKDSSIKRCTSPHKISEFYPCVNESPEEEKIALEYRGFGTKIDHVVIASLVTPNLSINHGPDTANPYSEGLTEEWIAFLPSYAAPHPLHHCARRDHLIITVLASIADKMRFFSFMNDHGYHFPYNKSWPQQQYSEWLHISNNDRLMPIFTEKRPAYEINFGSSRVLANTMSEAEQLRNLLPEQIPGCSRGR